MIDAYVDAELSDFDITKDQKISIVGKSKLLDFPTMPTTAESFPLLISLFPYTLNLYLVNAIMSLFKL